MAEDLIRYDVLVQDALRGIVRKVLSEVARTGLPGDHHFYISFETMAPGVQVSNRVRSKYPTEMTIVLQHQFWDLVVTENAFDIGLSFGGVPERLHIPFKAVKGFFDPHVQFNLQFEPYRSDEAEDGGELEKAALMSVVAENEEAAEGMERTVAALNSDEPMEEAGNDSAETDSDAAENGAEETVPDAEAQDGETRKEPEDDDNTGADVVSLDAFRKKP